MIRSFTRLNLSILVMDLMKMEVSDLHKVQMAHGLCGQGQDGKFTSSAPACGSGQEVPPV